MAGKSTTLTVKIVSDAKNAAQGFTDAESRVDRFQSGLNKASVVAGGVIAGLGAMGKAAFDSASNLQQASGAMDAVFGKSAAGMQKLAKQAATSTGLAQADYSQMASVIGSQLKNMGVAQDALMPNTNALISRGADLAAQFGGSTSDAVEALSSLLRGERDPIERYGVSISQAGLDAKIAAMGLDVSSEAAKKNSTYLATLALLSEQTATANGAFAREADTAAGAQQRASAQFENAKAALGDVLLPVVAAAMTRFSEFSGFLTQHKGVVIGLAAVVGTLAAATLAVNGAMAAYRTIMAIATAMQWAWNIAMTANPIGLIVLAIAAVVAAVVLMYNKFSWFKSLMDFIGKAILAYINGWITAIKWVVDKLSWVKDAASWVGGLFSAPMAVQVTPVADGTAAGLFGAADGAAAWAPIRGAALSPSAGGTSPSAGRGPGDGQVVNITVNGALDAQAVADQIAGLLRRRGVNLGQTNVVSL